MNCDIFVRLINLHAITVLLQMNSILFLIFLCMDQKDIMRLYFQITVVLIYKSKCNFARYIRVSIALRYGALGARVSSSSSWGWKCLFLTSNDQSAIGVLKWWVLFIWKCFRTSSVYIDWWTRIPFGKYSTCKSRQNYILLRSFISNSFFI